MSLLQQRDLKRHVENKHEGVKYPCSSCEYAAAVVFLCDLSISYYRNNGGNSEKHISS